MATIADLTGMDGTATMRSVQFHTRAYAFNGRNGMRKIDGVSWQKAGIVRPVFTPTATLGGTGLTGTYRYYVTASNSKHLDIQGRPVESIPSLISAEISPVNQTVTLNNIPATHVDPQVDSFRIYRNKDGVYDTDLTDDVQDFFYVATVLLGTTTYADSTPDEDLTGAAVLRFNQNVPPTFKYGAIFGERFFGCGFDPITTGTAAVPASTTVTFTGVSLPDGVVGCWFQIDGDAVTYRVVARPTATTITLDRAYSATVTGQVYTLFRYPWEIYFSEFEDAEAWGPDGEGLRNKLEVPGHQTLTGLIGYMGNLLVFTARDIYVITGKGPDRSSIQLLPDPYFKGLGAISGDAITAVDNEIHFLSGRGPARLAGGKPELYGVKLNTDWLTPLSAAKAMLATCGTDDEDVFYAVPAITATETTGQSVNSKVFRYERATDSWWEETESCPRLFVRQDGDNGQVSVLYYTQGRFIIQPKSGTLDATTNTRMDLVTAALSGTIASISGDGEYFDVSGTPFPTTGAKLEQCYVRIYRNGSNIVYATRRITTNTSSRITWSLDTAIPGGGVVNVLSGTYTYEIGLVNWSWRTRDVEIPGHLKQSQKVAVVFGQRSTTHTLQKTDYIDGVIRAPHQVSSQQLHAFMDIGRANFDYACKIGSRNGATVRSLTLDAVVETENR